MFINPTSVISRLSSERNIARVLVSDVVKEARGLVVSPIETKLFGEKNLIPALKPIIALVGTVDGATRAGEIFDVAASTVTKAISDNRDKLEKELEPVRALAIERLSLSISKITDEKLQDVGPLNLSNIARNLSTVIGNTRKKDSEEGGNKFQFNIFAPGPNKMKEYEVMDVR